MGDTARRWRMVLASGETFEQDCINVAAWLDEVDDHDYGPLSDAADALRDLATPRTTEVDGGGR